MQSRVPTSQPCSDHRARLTAALVTGTALDRQAFLEGLLQDAALCEEARRSFLSQLQRRGIHGTLFALAAEESLCTVLRAAFRRLDQVLLWDAGRGPLAAWWGLQATFEFNNDGRRQAERACGLRRSASATEAVTFTPLYAADEAGEETALDLCDPGSDPALRFEAQEEADHAAALLGKWLSRTADRQTQGWLEDWLAAEVLEAQAPVTILEGQVKLSWRYGAQLRLAGREQVSDRTLRNRARKVEQALTRGLELSGLV
ncbi:hypothetical protein SAMN04488058_1407 [Deinococcus reticulitermitis]|uniref:Uncharacterized protein n=1 Tax=Deinococcus reticulitermitis TaxID=856736 RepID=A0A1H7CTQ2_9DEIO|nr:hypothetical protein [Deinococcus reticulitermitis]SEJ92979.1 hypothetical protein SAMN04488058_1407 [Deinococcus reticulitermitis]